VIISYNTKVVASKTVAQIIALLSKKGAHSITQDFYGDGRVKAIRFVMKVGEVPVCFSLPCNIEGVAGVLAKQQPYTARARKRRDQYVAEQREQAERVSWRILLTWVEAQIAMIETGQAEAAQVFMPYAQDTNGQTMFDLWRQSTQLQLESGRK
jgi:hypothetical protein